jgi:hypothetical protein
MSSLPAERSETEPSLRATESPGGPSSLPTNRLPQGSAPRGDSKTQSSLNAAMIASRSWRLKASVTPGGAGQPWRSTSCAARPERKVKATIRR